MEMSTHPVAAGVIAGIVHHSVIQYPNQAKLFTTFYAFAFANTIFIMLLLGPKDSMQNNGISRMSMDFVVFNTLYVRDH